MNYGWDVMEGSHCYEPMTGCATAGRTLPILEFAHDVAGERQLLDHRRLRLPRRALPAAPRRLLLRRLLQRPDLGRERHGSLAGRPDPPADHEAGITSFGQDERGEVYVVSQNGAINQLVELTRYPGSGRR